jgi:preprotein translocase subunit SecA
MLGMGYKTWFKTASINTLSKIFGYAGDTFLKQNLVQIGTVEGKSFILAVYSTVLTLIGFDVYCVCYSEYLSDRDFQTFKSLFGILNLTEKINYDTFNKICENMINEKGIKTVSKNQLECIHNNTKT